MLHHHWVTQAVVKCGDRGEKERAAFRHDDFKMPVGLLVGMFHGFLPIGWSRQGRIFTVTE